MTRTCLGYQKGSLHTLTTPFGLSVPVSLVKGRLPQAAKWARTEEDAGAYIVCTYVCTCALLVQGTYRMVQLSHVFDVFSKRKTIVQLWIPPWMRNRWASSIHTYVHMYVCTYCVHNVHMSPMYGVTIWVHMCVLTCKPSMCLPALSAVGCVLVTCGLVWLPAGLCRRTWQRRRGWRSLKMRRCSCMLQLRRRWLNYGRIRRLKSSGEHCVRMHVCVCVRACVCVCVHVIPPCPAVGSFRSTRTEWPSLWSSRWQRCVHFTCKSPWRDVHLHVYVYSVN